MRVTFLQTSDPIFYYPMLVETAKTVRALCLRHGFSYEQYVGIKRGHMPWQASFNRIYMLKEMIDRGVDGWAFYMDADAFIQDLDFDIVSYLEERRDAAAIFSGYSSSDIPYDINSGGFAINLSHPIGKAIVLDWYQSSVIVPTEPFNAAVYWERDLANDQHLLFDVLRHYVSERRLESSMIFERANASYVNNGPFVAQFLRSMYPTFEQRLSAIKARVAEIVREEEWPSEKEGPGIYLNAHHPRLVTSVGRKTVSGIRSNGAEGGLMFGPYIHLDRGHYVARIFGEIRLGPDQETHFASDVAIDRGHGILAKQLIGFTTSQRGKIAEMPFTLEQTTDSLEIRVTVPAGADISIHAVQIIEEASPLAH